LKISSKIFKNRSIWEYIRFIRTNTIYKLDKKLYNYAISRLKFGSKGENVIIQNDCDFIHSENIYLGNDILIGDRTRLYAQATITIKSGTIFADGINIRTANHNYNSNDLQYIPFDGRSYCKPVMIEENVWIGSDVLILPGVTIGEGVVIGAGSVVTRDIEPMAVVGGNPAKVLKYRDVTKYSELKEKELIFMKYNHQIKRENILR
jgi:acetyltransferase-like isoleucine patch superfamily enzyme